MTLSNFKPLMVKGLDQESIDANLGVETKTGDLQNSNLVP